MSLARRIWNVFRRAPLERDLDDELEFHRAMRIDRLRERGLRADEAEFEMRHRMGNLTVAKEEMRDARLANWLASSLQDLRHGMVLLRRDAGLSFLIVLVLALGIGGNAAIFTLLKTAFLDPLPFRDAGRLVSLYDRYGVFGGTAIGPTIPEYLDIRRRSTLLEDAAFLDHRDFQLMGADEPVRVFAARVTASFFPLLGVRAAIGRTFTADENLPGKTHRAILSDAVWRGRFGADPNIVGRTLQLNDEPSIVVGVLPPGFAFDYPNLGVPETVEIYVPFVMDDYYMLRSGEFSNVRRVITLARLRPGATLQQAASELASIANTLSAEYPALYHGRKGESEGFSMGAKPLREAIVGSGRQLLALLLGGVGVLFLIACANTAQLLLARSLQRGREVAIRAALGASRLRLVRQFLMEGLVLATCGGAAGLLISGAMTRLLVELLPGRNPVFDQAHPDARVVVFTLALSMVSALLFAVVPAVKGSVWTPGPALTARTAIGQGNRWRHAMVALEAALSVFLLSGAGLLAQNLWKLVSTPAGFDPNHVAVMRVRLPFRREQATHPIASVAYRDYLEKIAAIPGVDSAASVTGLPLRGAAQRDFRIEGDPEDPAALTRQIALFQIVSPDYFRTLRIPLLAGRTFRDDDIVNRPRVAIVNREFVRRFGNGRDLIGRQLGPGMPATIVGVVGDVRMSALNTAPEPEIYASYLQAYEPNIYIAVRSSLPQAELVSRVKGAIHSAYFAQAVFNVSTMDQVLANSLAEPRFHAFLIGAFALLALAMAASGMYSVISCLVAQRTGEMAIRVALGAGRGAIARTVLGATGAWAAAGLASGLVCGLAASNTVRRLSETSVAASPEMYLLVALFFVAVTAVALYAPVRRATRLDPAVALRCE
jgi:putative ABC transport system permease protein